MFQINKVYITLACFLFFSSTFAQHEIVVPNFNQDATLFYDTVLSVKNKPTKAQPNNFGFDEDLVAHRLDSLNNLSPINLEYTNEIGKYIKFYLNQRPQQVAKLRALSNYYFPIFEEFLDKNDLPLELKYLPIIESSLNPNAKSPAGAVGLWQFMYYTAKEHDLRINSYLDERKDIYKSTQAACNYLSKAYQVFNDWELAIASYNSGRGNVTKAIRRSGGVLNYWKIRPFLPRETQNYIPAFIAAAYIMNFAEFHGILPDTSYLFKRHKIDSVFLDRPVKIAHLAQVLNIDRSLLEQLNPAYKIKLVPHLENEKFPILLPDYKWGVFLNNEDSIYNLLRLMEEKESLQYPAYSDIEKITYKVKRGDYLGRIARQHNCRVSDIMMWNDLKTTKITEGKRLYIYKTIK